MAESLTLAEMERAFPDEWVFIVEPDTGPDLKVRSGTVAAHGKDRDKVYDEVRHLRPKRSAMLFLGDPFPADTVFLL